MIKQLPVSVEAEQAVLGAIIVDAKCLDIVGGMLVPDDFYLGHHKHIYTTLMNLYTTSSVIDTVTLVNAYAEYSGKDTDNSAEYIYIGNSLPLYGNRGRKKNSRGSPRHFGQSWLCYLRGGRGGSEH